MSARKHSNEYSEIKEGQEEHGKVLKEISRALNFMAAEKGRDSRVLGGVVSVGGQSSLGSDVGYPAGPFRRTSSITINPPSSFEEDSITEPPLSLPEKHLYQEKYDLAVKEIAAQKRANQATDAENKSLKEQLEAYQSKRVKRPENIVPTSVRMPPHVEAKQKRAEEQAIERKIKGRRKNSEILASSNLPTPYKSKLRSRRIAWLNLYKFIVASEEPHSKIQRSNFWEISSRMEHGPNAKTLCLALMSSSVDGRGTPTIRSAFNWAE
eukprot:scaffold7513_cov76-Skeletonema_dohrnii-CCMP3373.AAC.5